MATQAPLPHLHGPDGSRAVGRVEGMVPVALMGPSQAVVVGREVCGLTARPPHSVGALIAQIKSVRRVTTLTVTGRRDRCSGYLWRAPATGDGEAS